MLFEPDCELLAQLGINASESVVAVGEHESVCLHIQNFNGVTVQLEAGMRLGTIKPVEVSTVGDLDISCNATVKVVDSSPECLEKLYSEVIEPVAYKPGLDESLRGEEACSSGPSSWIFQLEGSEQQATFYRDIPMSSGAPVRCHLIGIIRNGYVSTSVTCKVTRCNITTIRLGFKPHVHAERRVDEHP